MYVVVSVDILDLTQLDLLLKVQHLSPIYWAEGVSDLFQSVVKSELREIQGLRYSGIDWPREIMLTSDWKISNLN